MNNNLLSIAPGLLLSTPSMAHSNAPSMTHSDAPSMTHSNASSNSSTGTVLPSIETRVPYCKFTHFPEGNPSACLSSSSKNCVDTSTKPFALTGEYNCICPKTYMVGKKSIQSSRADKSPALTSMKIRNKTVYNLSCK
jgi:hypothetical protein